MNLQEIKGSYEVIISLGSACNPGIQLRKHNLRNFSGPLDWSVSVSLSDVTRLLENRFHGYMELNNMRKLDGSAHILDDGNFIEAVDAHLIKDTLYNIVSVHDFPIIPNQDWTETYPSFKEKLNRRIDRFLEKITNSQSVLFVRWLGSNEETVKLNAVLSEIINGPFNILIFHPIEGSQGVSEIDWGIDNVCALKVPNLPFDDEIWDYVLNGITLTD